MGRWIDADTLVHWQSYDDETETFPDHEGTIAEFLDSMTDEGCPEAVDAVPVGAYEQVVGERNVAVEQLRQLGYELGEKVTPVVRCKDCKWCNMGDCEHKFGLLVANDENYCSRGERKDGEAHD